MMDDDTTQVEPTAYEFLMAVGTTGEVWVSAFDVVTFLRAASSAMIKESMYGLTIADVACALTIEADALELRSHEMAFQPPADGTET